MFRPLGDRLVVELDESLSNVIHIPPVVEKWRSKDGSVEGWNRGRVIRVGPGKKHPKSGALLPMCVQPGDVVRFSELEFPEDREDGKRVCLISEMDILGVEEAA